jgi:hypothetical protein
MNNIAVACGVYKNKYVYVHVLDLSKVFVSLTTSSVLDPLYEFTVTDVGNIYISPDLMEINKFKNYPNSLRDVDIIIDDSLLSWRGKTANILYPINSLNIGILDRNVHQYESIDFVLPMKAQKTFNKIVKDYETIS